MLSSAPEQQQAAPVGKCPKAHAVNEQAVRGAGAAVLLDFPLPLAMYKKLLGQVATLRELSEFDPTLGRSLQALLDYAGGRPLPLVCTAASAPALQRVAFSRLIAPGAPEVRCALRLRTITHSLIAPGSGLDARMCACAAGTPFHPGQVQLNKLADGSTGAVAAPEINGDCGRLG